MEGHREGARALKRTVRSAAELGIKELTVFAFSTENWSRPDDEVEGLMAMFGELIESETQELDEVEVSMRFIGRLDDVPPWLLEKMQWAERATVGNKRMTLFVAFNYGGRAEMVDAARDFSPGQDTSEDEKVSEDAFRKHLYAPDMHDPDLLIRTSGEMRISNFLLWQCAYTELYFTDVLWPDFGGDHLAQAMEEYMSRRRRFGAREDGF